MRQPPLSSHSIAARSIVASTHQSPTQLHNTPAIIGSRRGPDCRPPPALSRGPPLFTHPPSSCTELNSEQLEQPSSPWS